MLGMTCHQQKELMSIMAEQTFHVVGMTCEHCVAAVTEEASLIPGVTDVEVIWRTATAVTSRDPLERDAVADAVDEAGYALVDPA